VDVIGDSLFTMLQLQRTLNAREDAEWYTRRPPFLRAAIITAATAMNHYGCALWDARSPDLPRVQQDMVGLLQLLLSHEMLSQGRRDEELARAAKELENVYAVNRHLDVFSGQGFLDKMELLITKAASRDDIVLWPVFFSSTKDAGLDWNMMSRAYFSENVLKLFRQDYGSETGAYTAIWGGKADSKHLDEIMSEAPTLDLSAIRQALVMRYAAFTGRRATDKSSED
jgi:hypothetical protein